MKQMEMDERSDSGFFNDMKDNFFGEYFLIQHLNSEFRKLMNAA